MTIRFTTIRDPRSWIDQHMGGADGLTPEQIDLVTEQIHRDPDRPDWGLADWTSYLDSLPDNLLEILPDDLLDS